MTKFDPTTVSLLKSRIRGKKSGPPSHAAHGPWNAILAHFFPLSRGYEVEPILCAKDPSEPQGALELAFQVNKLNRKTARRTVVLMVHLCDDGRWPEDADDLCNLVHTRTQAGFVQPEHRHRGVIYWILGRQECWQYGKKLNDQDFVEKRSEETLHPISEWQVNLHEPAAYRDFAELARLIEEL